MGTFEGPAQGIGERFQVVQSLFNPPVNYNVAPTSTVPVVRLDEGGRVLDGFRWGVVAFWAKDIKEGLRAVNARSETAASKPTFRDAFKRRRCLIPVSGYYEWQKTLTGKQPFNIHLPEYAPFAFAGLWSEWNGPEGPVRSCTILTTEPNGQLAGIHNRMPVILLRHSESVWLDPTLPPAQAQALLRSYPEGELMATEVHRRVGRVGYKEPDCIAPLVLA